MKIRYQGFAVLFILGLSGCGGSSGNGAPASPTPPAPTPPPPENLAPTAVISTISELKVDRPVTLDGSQSSDPEDDDIEYRWSVVRRPVGSESEITSPTTSTASFTPDVEGIYEIQLEVQDDRGASDQSSVTAAALTLILKPSNIPVASFPGRDGVGFLNVYHRFDLNFDGADDVIFAGNKWKGAFVDEGVPLQVLINDGDNGFVDGREAPEALNIAQVELVHPWHAHSEDFNRDGFPDLLVTGSGFDGGTGPGERNVLFLTDNVGILHDVSRGDPAFDYKGFTHGSSVADLDRDGDLDIVVSDLGGDDVPCRDSLSILYNDGAGSFERRTDVIADSLRNQCQSWTSVIANDFDGDGYPDLFFGRNTPPSKTQILFGDQTGKFFGGEGREFNMPEVEGFPIVPTSSARDLDGDGDLDLVISRTRQDPFYHDRYIQFMINNADRTFTDLTEEYLETQDTSQPWAQEFIWSDLNGDGQADLMIRYSHLIENREPNAICAFIRTASGQFKPLSSANQPLYGVYVPIEADGDGDEDILVYLHSGFDTENQVLNWTLLINE